MEDVQLLLSSTCLFAPVVKQCHPIKDQCRLNIQDTCCTNSFICVGYEDLEYELQPNPKLLSGARNMATGLFGKRQQAFPYHVLTYGGGPLIWWPQFVYLYLCPCLSGCSTEDAHVKSLGSGDTV